MRADLKEKESHWANVCGKLFQIDGPAYDNDLSPNVFVFTRGVTNVRVSDADRNCLAGVQELKEIGQILRGCSRDGIETDS